jgi:hypothetical protein
MGVELDLSHTKKKNTDWVEGEQGAEGNIWTWVSKGWWWKLHSGELHNVYHIHRLMKSGRTKWAERIVPI